MELPVVSVILPCYNASRHLRQCLDSILRQTLSSIEILCVDDGSTDDTLSILRDYQSTDPRIRVICQENAGAGAARNAGLALSSGTYLSFLDADDFFEPDMLEKAVAAAEEYRADYVVFRSDRYYPSKEEFREIPWSLRTCDLPPYMPFTYRQLTDNVFLTFVGWAWDKLFRRSFVEEHRLYFQEQRTTNDMLFVFSALICAKRIAVRQEILAHQRRESGDSLSVTREKSWHCFYDALIALRQRLIRENVYWELEQDFINYSLHFCLWHLNSLAEPTHTLLLEQLKGAWFRELGISGKQAAYFYNRDEFAQYKKIINTSPSEASAPTGHSGAKAPVPDWLKDFPELAQPDAQSMGEIWIRFDALQARLMEEPQLWLRYRSDYWKQKMLYCSRLFQEIPQKTQHPYYVRLCRELNRAQMLGHLERDSFSRQEWAQVQQLIRHSDGRISLLRSVPLIRWCGGLIPKPLKTKLISILATKKRG